jgi:uncharacterized cupredoxin-like copper-binding protein
MPSQHDGRGRGRLMTASRRRVIAHEHWGGSVSPRGEDRNGFGIATMTFSFIAVMLSMAALIVAAQAWSRSNDTKADVGKLASGGLLGSKVGVDLEEYQVLAKPLEVKAGSVQITAKNIGTIQHEMIVARSPTAEALPKVTQPGGERAVGDVDEEALPPRDAIGEIPEFKQGKTVTKSFKLSPGTYVLFCNIDVENPDGTVTSHYQEGMHTTVSVR